MKTAQLSDMIGGWFIGNFEPSIAKTDQFEVGVKHYKAGDVDELHYHKIATEVTIIISGEAIMCDTVLKPGDIMLLEPNEDNQFKAVQDTVLAVVKFPSVSQDKYLGASSEG